MVSGNRLNCCGITELVGLGSSSPAEIVRYAQNCSAAFFVLSGICGDTLKSGRGARFAQFVKKHHLGTVTSPGRRINPNSGNVLKVFVWTPNRENLNKWRDRK